MWFSCKHLQRQSSLVESGGKRGEAGGGSGGEAGGGGGAGSLLHGGDASGKFWLSVEHVPSHMRQLMDTVCFACFHNMRRSST